MTDPLLHGSQIPLLEKIAANTDSDALQRRARILLLYNDGKSTREIVEVVGISPRSVRFWRSEFLKRGVEIFSAAEDPGLPQKTAGEPTASRKEKSLPGKPTPPKTPFPRVRKNPGVKADDPMAEAGRKILRFHFAHMLSHENGTRLGKSIEELHDMRVATRRMRAAFEVFEPFFKPKAVKNHLKGLRATGRTLGRVRDLDVFMEKAERYRDALPEAERPGLEPLQIAWRREREIGRERLLAYLDSESYGQFKQDFTEFVSTPEAGARPISENQPRPNLVKHVAPVLIYTSLAAARAYDAFVATAAIEQLHALRIEFKKLRYTLEFFREVLGTQVKAVIDELKTLQDHLGDLNDANVACQVLREFIETWEERQIGLPLQERQNPEPVVAYLAVKHAERHNLAITFPQAWAHFNRPELLENVALAVSVL